MFKKLLKKDLYGVRRPLQSENGALGITTSVKSKKGISIWKKYL